MVMSLSWIRERSATWDEEKRRIVGGAAPGTFDSRYARIPIGALVPGEWWRVEDDGRTVGYGWMDVNWGDAEVLLATDVEARGRGVGTFIVEHLEDEARARGLNYLTNMVRPTHPEGARVSAWLAARGFVPSEDGRMLRAVVRAR